MWFSLRYFFTLHYISCIEFYNAEIWKSVYMHSLYMCMFVSYRKTSNTIRTKTEMFLVSSWSCLCPVHWSQVLCREWRCISSSAAVPITSEWWKISLATNVYYVRGLTVYLFAILWTFIKIILFPLYLFQLYLNDISQRMRQGDCCCVITR